MASLAGSDIIILEISWQCFGIWGNSVVKISFYHRAFLPSTRMPTWLITLPPVHAGSEVITLPECRLGFPLGPGKSSWQPAALWWWVSNPLWRSDFLIQPNFFFLSVLRIAAHMMFCFYQAYSHYHFGHHGEKKNVQNICTKTIRLNVQSNSF